MPNGRAPDGRRICHPRRCSTIARAGAAAGCTEALFTLGDKPELRYRAAREALAALGHDTTISYLREMCALVLKETGLLPHVNPGVMTRDEIASLREVSASMGIMLESSSDRLCEPGGVHYGSPDKAPAVRLEMMRLAGELAVPFTTGILIGIGETRAERLESLVAIRDLHARYGHIQEVIVQNFRAKPNTKRATAPEPDLDDLLWSIAAARLILPDDVHVQAPPNLSPGVYQKLIDAGIDDWGGVSPVTPDHVNPEAPWPEIEALAQRTAEMGKVLVQRLPVYPAYAFEADRWCAPGIATRVRRAIDAEGWAREDDWAPGLTVLPKPARRCWTASIHRSPRRSRRRCPADDLDEQEIVRLFAARDADYEHVITAADALRQTVSGETVRYVVNRNINYTNICYYRCKFCAFSKGKTHEALRGTPYDLDLDEMVRRSREAWDRGATEVCLQGGIHPDYTGATYVGICRAIKAALPDMHVHAFSPLEVTQGAATLGLSLHDFLAQLKDAGSRHAARHRGGNPRRRGAQDHLPGQGEHGTVARRGEHRASAWPAHHIDDHVRPRRTPDLLGAASAGVARPPGGDRRHHRVRAAALRAHGSADVSARPGAQGPDAARGGADARGGAARRCIR